MKLTLSELGFCSVQDKVILISVPKRNDGQTIVKLFRQAGALVVVVTDDKNPIAQIEEIKTSEIAFSDLTTEQRVSDLREEVIAFCLRKFGRIDILIHEVKAFSCAAARDHGKTVEDLSEMRRNIEKSFALVWAAAESMHVQGVGQLVIVSEFLRAEKNECGLVQLTHMHAHAGLFAALKHHVSRWRERGAHIRLSRVHADRKGGCNSSDSRECLAGSDPLKEDRLAAIIFQVVATQSCVNVDELSLEV